MTKSQINQAQAEAKLAVQYLNDSKDENFDALFLRPVAALHLRYDNLFRYLKNGVSNNISIEFLLMLVLRQPTLLMRLIFLQWPILSEQIYQLI